MASSAPSSAKSGSSGRTSAGSRSSKTPPSSAGKKTGQRGSLGSSSDSAIGKPPVVRHSRPSDKLNPKTIDPVSKTKWLIFHVL